MPPHPVSNFEIRKYYQNKPKFNSAYSGNNSSKIKDWTYITNLDEYESIATYQIILCMNAENVTNFDSFGVEYIKKKNWKSTENKNIKINVYRIQACDSITCR